MAYGSDNGMFDFEGGSVQPQTPMISNEANKILTLILSDVTTIRHMVQASMMPESEEREAEFDKEKRHRELIDALKRGGLGGMGAGGVGGPGGSGDESGKGNWLKNFIKTYLGFKALGGLVRSFFKIMRLGKLWTLLKGRGLLALRLLGPLAIAAAAIWLIPKLIDKWPDIAEKIKNWTREIWDTIKGWILEIPGVSLLKDLLFGDDEEDPSATGEEAAAAGHTILPGDEADNASLLEPGDDGVSSTAMGGGALSVGGNMGGTSSSRSGSSTGVGSTAGNWPSSSATAVASTPLAGDRGPLMSPVTGGSNERSVASSSLGNNTSVGGGGGANVAQMSFAPSSSGSAGVSNLSLANTSGPRSGNAGGQMASTASTPMTALSSSSAGGSYSGGVGSSGGSVTSGSGGGNGIGSSSILGSSGAGSSNLQMASTGSSSGGGGAQSSGATSGKNGGSLKGAATTSSISTASASQALIGNTGDTTTAGRIGSSLTDAPTALANNVQVIDAGTNIVDSSVQSSSNTGVVNDITQTVTDFPFPALYA